MDPPKFVKLMQFYHKVNKKDIRKIRQICKSVVKVLQDFDIF